ncbi:MAG: TIGR02186 family protein [Desulfovibrio sp.]
MKKTLTALALLATLALACGPAQADPAASLNSLPKTITIGTDYNGEILTFSGSVPEGSTAVVRMIGDRGDKHFKQKGKVLGMLWMNLATVSIPDVPGVLLIGLDGQTGADCDSALAGADLGFQSFRGTTDEGVFKEFLHLKQNEGLYQVQQGAIEYAPAKDGHRDFTARLALPSALRKGDYEVQLFAVRDGQVVAQAVDRIPAVLVGFPSMLSSLAFGHALLYGIMATFIAIMAGLLMTLVFKDRGGAH